MKYLVVLVLAISVARVGAWGELLHAAGNIAGGVIHAGLNVVDNVADDVGATAHEVINHGHLDEQRRGLLGGIIHGGL